MIKILQYCLIIFILFINVIDLNAQVKKDSSSNKVGVGGVDWFAYPYIYFTPETNWAFGAGGNVSFKIDSVSNPTSISGSGY